MSHRVFNSIAVLLYLSLFTVANSDTLLTIAQAESIAVNSAFGIKIDQQATISGKWQYWNAIGNFLPSVQASSQYLRLDEDYLSSPAGFFPGGSGSGGQIPVGLSRAIQQPVPTPVDTGVIPRNLFIHEISVRQAIINSSAIVGIQIASAAKDVQQYQSAATRQEVIFTVRESYYNTIAAQGRLNALQLALRFSQESLQNTRVRQESGVVTITEVLRWEAQVAENQASIAQAEAAVELSKLSLLSSMGYKLDRVLTRIKLQSIEEFASECTSATINTDTILNFDQNPSWKVVQRLTDVARLQRTLALTRFFPTLSGFYSYQWQAYEGVFPDNGGIWYLGLSLSVPIFTSFTTTSGYLQQRAEARRSVIESEQARNGFISQTRSSMLTFTSSLKQVQAVMQRRELMEKTLSIMDIRYRSGVASQTDLLQVAVETEQARVSYIQAITDCLIARARFKKSIGTLEVWR